MLITTGGMVNRTHVREIRVVGRNTQGVRIMGLKEGDKIASIAKVAQEEGEAVEADGQVETPPSGAATRERPPFSRDPKGRRVSNRS